MSIYKTQEERFYLNEIRNRYPYAEIINPSDNEHNIGKGDMKYYLNLVKQCDFVVFYGSSFGVITEIVFALLSGKNIIDVETFLPISKSKIFRYTKLFAHSKFIKNDIQQIADVIKE